MYHSDTSRVRPPTLRGKIAFIVTIASTTALLLNGSFGTMAMAVFIGLWGLYVMAWPGSSADALLRSGLPWSLPLFALLSTVWSTAPELTSRLAIEWLMTTGIAVLMARSLTVDRLLSAWMIGLVPVVLVSAAVGSTQYTETRVVADIGIFGSKNNFALHISEMLLVCAAVLARPKQRDIFRLIAVFGVVVGPVLLWRARSVGALLVFVPSSLLMGAIVAIGHLRQRSRYIAVAGALAMTATFVAVAIPAALTLKGDLLAFVGKSEDLTGRGLLWRRATELIEQRPILGVGYQAFWVQGNPEAEALWRSEHIAARTGFHFHNFYYNTAIELGYVGLGIGIVMFVLTAAAVLMWGVRRPGPESGFFCGMMLFLFLRSFVELDLGGGFFLTALILPVGWVFALGGADDTGWPSVSAIRSRPVRRS